MTRRKLRVFAVLWALAVFQSPARAQGPVITEFMAVNNRILADQDGDYSDWIEIFNLAASRVSLDGWYLTDSSTHVTKWRFPAVSLPAGGYLLVFASGKNRADAASQLHTGFKLSGDGGFLGLVDPQGKVVSAYSPAYPLQLADVSYGLRQPSAGLALVAPGAPASALIPTGPTPGAAWTTVGFNDATWIKGATGAGFDTGADYTALIGADLKTAMQGKNGSAYVRVPFSVTDPAGLDNLTLRMKYDDGFVAYLNGTEVARRNAPATLQWNSVATAAHGQPVTGMMSQDFDAPGTAYALAAYGTNAPPVVVAGGPSGKFLRLMPDNTGDLTNTVGFDRVHGQAEIIAIDFEFRMPPDVAGQGERADGFGFALLSTVEYGDQGPAPSVANVNWERPTLPDAFTVGFDIYDGSGTENTVSLNWNGVQATALKFGGFDFNNGVFNHARVEIRKDGTDSLVTLKLTADSLAAAPGPSYPVFTNFRILNMNPFDARVGFGGRTGGAFTSLDLDNIRVIFTPGSSEITYEDIDLSSRIGLLASGQNLLAIQGLNFAAGDKDFLVLPELTAMDFGAVVTSAREYFPQPTPGAPNLPGLPGVADEPQLSHPPGAYPANFNLTLSVPTPGSTIRYTLDGTNPTQASTIYSAALPIQKTMVVKARTFKTGLLPSRIVEANYFRLDSASSGFSSNLPLVLLTTSGQGIGQSAFTPVSAAFIDTQPDRSAMTGAVDWSGSAGIKIRGSSSTGFPKKQYAFETWDENRADNQVSLLGFPAQSDWILYAPYTDKTLMRDALSYAWSNDIGRYAVRSRYVELFLKSSTTPLLAMSDYQGVYVLLEKIKLDKNRVDLKKLFPSNDAEPEITGGYILKKDRLDPGDSGFTTQGGQLLAFVTPKEQEITPEQRAYIKGYLDDFETVLYGPNFSDPVDGYAAYIDVDSFIDHHLLVEVTKNIDGFRLSTFMYKDRGKKLHMGPIWDYNLTLGNADYLEGWNPAGWYNALLGDGDYPWWRRLFQDPEFTQRYIDRWTRLRREKLAADKLLADVDEAATILDEAQVRNYQRWPILGTYVWPNWYIGATYEDEVTWMKGWIQGRLDWMDSNWLRAPTLSQDGGVIPPNFQLGLSAPAGTIYYTLDGSDPRLPGGQVSPTARQHGSSSQLTLVSSQVTPEVHVLVPASDIALTWTQLAYNDAAWTKGTTGLGVGYENNTGYEALINVDVKAQMFGAGKATSVYIRIPFQVQDPSAFDTLTLRMKYDDGFVAYLNGQPIGSRNAPAAPAWNSAASADHADPQAILFEDLNATGVLAALRAGANVLCIHGMNTSNASSDLLFIPQLEASSSAAGAPFPLIGPTRVVARTRLGSSWSGPTEASFVPNVALSLRITEVMYHPGEPPAGSILNADDFEFIELQNIGGSPLSLLGARFVDGIEFDFSTGLVPTLGPGEHVLVVKDLAAFESRYDSRSMKIAGEYTGNLDNLGESIVLLDGRGQPVLAFDYDDLWYPVTDGDGFSLTIVDPAGNPSTWSNPSSWKPSNDLGGSPGAGESAPPAGGFQLPGDTNQNAAVDLSDAIAILLHLFTAAAPPFPCAGSSMAAGGNLAVFDENGDGRVNISDPLYLLTFLFRQGPPPAGWTTCVRVVDCPDACFR